MKKDSGTVILKQRGSREDFRERIKRPAEEVRVTAHLACMKKLPLETILEWVNDEDYNVRHGAAFACRNSNVPIEKIQRLLEDEHPSARRTASKLYFELLNRMEEE